MNQHDLLDAIGNADEKLLERSEKRFSLRRITAVAAAACLLVVGCATGIPLLLSDAPAEEAGYTGHAASDDYMIYYGPVLALQGNTQLTAHRNLDMDFSLCRPHTVSKDGEQYETTENACLLTDTYRITNPTDSDITAELYLPFISSYSSLAEDAPRITVDGETVKTTRSSGAYCGGFQGTFGSADYETESYNLDTPSNWTDYAAVLQNETDRTDSLSAVTLPEQSITVYELSDFSEAEEDAATIAVSFSLKNGSRLYSYNMNGFSQNDETGEVELSVFLPRKNRARPQQRILFAVSGDAVPYTMQGYNDGSCGEAVKNDAITAQITTYETTLSELLTEIIADEARTQTGELKEAWDAVSPELVHHSVAELLTTHGALSDAPKDRYTDSPQTRLGEIVQDAFFMDRIFYDTFSVTVPAGESITVTAASRKSGSYDYEPDDEDADIYGYELLMQSSLTLAETTATVLEYDAIEIVRQNFGFDLENGITTATLNASEERYFIEVRKK